MESHRDRDLYYKDDLAKCKVQWLCSGTVLKKNQKQDSLCLMLKVEQEALKHMSSDIFSSVLFLGGAEKLTFK